MPYRRRRTSYLLPVVTILAVTAPFGLMALSDSPDIRAADESKLAAIPADLAEVGLAAAPDITLPLRELTGLNLPDLHLSDLRMLPIPKSIKVPEGLPLPPGLRLPGEIPLPRMGQSSQPKNYGPFPHAPGYIAEPGPDVSPLDPSADSGAAGSAPAPADNSGEIPSAAVDPGTPPAAGPAPAEAPAAEAPADPAPASPVVPGDPTTPALAAGAVPDDLVDKVGTQVKELSRDKPFSMVALTAKDLAGLTAMFRAKRPDGTWGPWYSADEVDGRSKGTKTTGTEPIYVGNTKSVQILTTRKPAAAPVPATQIPAEGVVPADAVEPAPFAHDDTDPAQIDLEKLAAILIDPGRGAIDENLSAVAAPLPGGGPKVITRAQWGADESLRCEEPTYDDGVSAITVHHTAGRNDYTKAESPGIVRAIYSYHAKTLGWCDIGYNALVDKYGQIFEGRYGGLDRPVEGAHAGGFNINTAGVAFMGNHMEEEPTEPAMQSMGKFIGWRAKVAGLDPEGSTTMTSEGSDYTRYALGEAVKLPNVFAHRDVGNTSCPGDAAYDLMDRIRELAETAAGTSAAVPSTTVRAKPEQRNAGNPQHPSPSTTETEPDLSALADLTEQLLGMLDRSTVARYWNEQGGANSALGQPKSIPMTTADGGQSVQFVNGYVYSTPGGQVFTVVGKILERFIQLGASTGVLGLPLTNEYLIQDGARTDFQHGSLIFDKLTGIVTTVLKSLDTDKPGGPPMQAAPIPAQLPEAN
ncbi:N-acetylmuramoyl-L-alanine amidase [Nocardia jejuensis]|uniref:N-acetylmuramoyl-L-alanine amidase n=1 Tax=Nocardia jejuensis TaxID=328049 RepID=UPI000A01C925|nr:N-acetylmuramoyl-L-alanine amidase [Nocardia jejuensis]